MGALLEPPLAQFAAYLGMTAETTTIVESNGQRGTTSFQPVLSGSRLRHPFPFAFYFKTRSDANIICNLWADFLEDAQPFPEITVEGGKSVSDIARSSQTSPIVAKLRETGHAGKFDKALGNCKPIFSLPYAQYPGLYVHEDAARLSAQGCPAKYRHYNLVTNSFVTAFETMICNAYTQNTSRPPWRLEVVHYEFNLPQDVLGGPLVPLPRNQAPLPLPGPLVDPNRWESPFISSSPFPSPVATPSRMASHQSAFIRTASRTPGTPGVSTKELACRLFEASNSASSPRHSPRLINPRSRSTTPTPLGLASTLPGAVSSPSRAVLSPSLPEPLRRLIAAFFPEHVEEANCLFAEVQSYDNANAACTDVLPKLPAFITVKQFMYGLAFIFETGGPLSTPRRGHIAAMGESGGGQEDVSPFLDA